MIITCRFLCEHSRQLLMPAPVLLMSIAAGLCVASHDDVQPLFHSLAQPSVGSAGVTMTLINLLIAWRSYRFERVMKS